MKPWTFDGVEVARTDAESCGLQSPTSGYICTRLPGHDGDHIAHVFHEHGGASPSAAVDTWAREESEKS